MADAVLRAVAAPAEDRAACVAVGAVARTPWSHIALAVLGLRILLSALALGTVWTLPGSRGAGPQALLLDPWRHFDALWFVRIAAHGYGRGDLSTAYMPLYPLLLRCASVLTGGHLFSAAILASNLSCVGAVGLIWRWVADRHGGPVAWRTIALLLLFPDGFFLLGAYSESTFLLFSAGTLLALGRGRWLLAGTLATLATLTRLQGLVLVVPILTAAWPHRREARTVAVVFIAATLPPIGSWLYQRLLFATLGGGDLLHTFRNQWNIPIQAPWQTVWRYVTVIRSPKWSMFHSHVYNYVMLWDLTIAALGLLVLILSWRRLGPALCLYGLAGWCFMMTRWYSTGRYTLAILPFFLALALWTETPRRFRWLSTASLALLVFFVTQFVQNSWID